MAEFGYTLMCEQSGAAALVADAVAAKRVGFDFGVISDHYFPWLDSQGHSPNAWPVLGAVAQATDRVELITYVICPTMRHDPAVVAQQAATVGLLSQDDFTLGLDAGFTRLAVGQIGGDRQTGFLDWAHPGPLPALRGL
jgi:G6PDH family F420-dependent oxidoreductase